MQRTITNITPRTMREAEMKAKRVAAYARVSSGKDAMLHSLSAQVSHYSGLIQKTPGWAYAGVYADEATTGTKDTRVEFQRLLADCRAGKIDLIITKSISRFARNTITTLETIRELRALNVDVYFEEQNIHTLGGDGEFILTLLAVYAQEEARSVSDNQKWRIKANYEQGLPWSITMYGFKLIDGILQIVPEEAEALRLAADLYLAGNGGLKIARALNAAGYRTKRGNLWRENSIRSLLSNEKLAGDMLLQKTFVNDPIEKRQLPNNGEKPQYYVSNSHEPILDRDTYECILAERERRADKYRPAKSRGPRRAYPFTGMIICEQCGAHYRRKTANAGGRYEKIVWICTTFNTKGKAHCASQQIPEDILCATAARAIGLPEFDEAVFAREVQAVRVPEGGTLVFLFRDGSEVAETWQNKSRRDSWSPEMKQQAREHAFSCNARRGGTAL